MGQVDPQPGNHDVDELATQAFLRQRCVRAAIVLRGRQCDETMKKQLYLSQLLQPAFLLERSLGMLKKLERSESIHANLHLHGGDGTAQ